MNRSGYTEDCDHQDVRHAMYRGHVSSATRGKRGQALLRDLLAALDEMPVKSLISGALRAEGEVCALGCLGAKRGFDLEAIDPEDYDYMAVPLPKNEDRSLDLERERHGFKRGRVAVIPQVPDQQVVAALVLTSTPLCIIRDSSSPTDGKIRSHAIDQADEAVVEDVDTVSQHWWSPSDRVQ